MKPPTKKVETKRIPETKTQLVEKLKAAHEEKRISWLSGLAWGMIAAFTVAVITILLSNYFQPASVFVRRMEGAWGAVDNAQEYGVKHGFFGTLPEVSENQEEDALVAKNQPETQIQASTPVPVSEPGKETPVSEPVTLPAEINVGVDLGIPASGYPANETRENQIKWVSDRAGVQMEKVDANEKAAFQVNYKDEGVPAQEAICFAGSVCEWHLTDGNTVVYLIGHGQKAFIEAGTWRMFDQYGENICTMLYGAFLNAANENYVLHPQGKLEGACDITLTEYDSSKGDETALVSQLVGTPLIRISTEPGAWQFNAQNVGTVEMTCPEGFVCTVNTGVEIIFVIGSGQKYTAEEATFRLLKHYEEDACVIFGKEQLNGAVASDSVNCP